MRISVYITSYNQETFLWKATESVLAQTLPPSQVIIVGDCPTDGAQQLIAEYVSRRYWHLLESVDRAQDDRFLGEQSTA